MTSSRHCMRPSCGSHGARGRPVRRTYAETTCRGEPGVISIVAAAVWRQIRTAAAAGPTEHDGESRSQAKLVSSTAPGNAMRPTAELVTAAPNPSVDAKNGAGAELSHAFQTFRGSTVRCRSTKRVRSPEPRKCAELCAASVNLIACTPVAGRRLSVARSPEAEARSDRVAVRPVSLPARFSVVVPRADRRETRRVSWYSSPPLVM